MIAQSETEDRCTQVGSPDMHRLIDVTICDTVNVYQDKD